MAPEKDYPGGNYFIPSAPPSDAMGTTGFGPWLRTHLPGAFVKRNIVAAGQDLAIAHVRIHIDLNGVLHWTSSRHQRLRHSNAQSFASNSAQSLAKNDAQPLAKNDAQSLASSDAQSMADRVIADVVARCTSHDASAGYIPRMHPKAVPVFPMGLSLNVVMDGPASVMKMALQRERRAENQRDRLLDSAALFARLDPTNFTPGLPFMHALESAILLRLHAIVGQPAQYLSNSLSL